ncbi:MAG: peptide-methionine (S)-S-oxide reductase MsrA, partial [Burkholderiaceae bacterium]|nr:peptide-methionine (S)-S-oxide reductase MsrA [Burkholderiaceae bacterium]
MSLPNDQRSDSHASDLDTIVLGGGCFWCTEGVFLRVKGVRAVESGYCNGHVIAPTYEQVCTGESGHVEVVRVTFDTREIQLSQILEVFFSVHDATTLNQQGNDVGPQYRSGVYLTRSEQLPIVTAFIADLASREQALRGRITTEVVPLHNYSTAESFHQQYYD